MFAHSDIGHVVNYCFIDLGRIKRCALQSLANVLCQNSLKRLPDSIWGGPMGVNMFSL